VLSISDEHDDIDHNDAAAMPRPDLQIHMVTIRSVVVSDVQWMRQCDHDDQYIDFHHDIDQRNRDFDQHEHDGHESALSMPGSKHDDFDIDHHDGHWHEHNVQLNNDDIHYDGNL
jgi:hypothetical protein